MAGFNGLDPQHASEYEERTTSAVKSVLVEIGQILGSYRGKFAVVGGSVPWLLIEGADMEHVGTMDVDLALDAEALGEGEYADLVRSLLGQGYTQVKGAPKFQLRRDIVPSDDGPPIEIVVDFLMPRDATIVLNRPPLLADFAVQRASGADLALRYFEMVQVSGAMPTGGRNTVEIAVASVPALLAMKGYAINNRRKQKDAYDIYYVIRNYEGGIAALSKDCESVLQHQSGVEGFNYINAKFDAFDSFGPTSVRNFVSESDILGERTAEQWQQDAFGQVDALMRALGLRTHATAGEK
jgi:hypothetical protein